MCSWSIIESFYQNQQAFGLGLGLLMRFVFHIVKIQLIQCIASLDLSLGPLRLPYLTTAMSKMFSDYVMLSISNLSLCCT